MYYDPKKLKAMSAQIAALSKKPGKPTLSPFAQKISHPGLANILKNAKKPTTERVRIFRGKEGREGRDGRDGQDGKDGKDGKSVSEIEVIAKILSLVSPIIEEQKVTPDTPEILAQKINTLKDAIEISVIKGFVKPEDLVQMVIKELKTGKTRLDVRDVTGMPQKKNGGLNMNDMRWHGGGATLVAGAGITITTNTNGTTTLSSSTSSAVIAFVGTIDDSNVTFTAASQPSVVVMNGAFYFPTGGAITWTYVAGTVTMSSPPGVGGSIFGLS